MLDALMPGQISRCDRADRMSSNGATLAVLLCDGVQSTGGIRVVVGLQQGMVDLHKRVRSATSCESALALRIIDAQKYCGDSNVFCSDSRVAERLSVEMLGCAISHTHVQRGVLSAKDLLHRRICNIRTHTDWVQIPIICGTNHTA